MLHAEHINVEINMGCVARRCGNSSYQVRSPTRRGFTAVPMPIWIPDVVCDANVSWGRIESDKSRANRPRVWVIYIVCCHE